MMLTEDRHEVVLQFGRDDRSWFRPMDLGGADGSRHSAALAPLERTGLVESRQRRPYTRGIRGSKLYRLTAAGLAAELEDHR
jgi:hypothetical protein